MSEVLFMHCYNNCLLIAVYYINYLCCWFGFYSGNKINEFLVSSSHDGFVHFFFTIKFKYWILDSLLNR